MPPWPGVALVKCRVTQALFRVSITKGSTKLHFVKLREDSMVGILLLMGGADLDPHPSGDIAH